MPIDGMYFDWCGAFIQGSCAKNPHGPKKHYDIDGVIRVLEWTKNHFGPDGIVVGHIGGGAGEYPNATIEGFLTMAVTLEELISTTDIPRLVDVQASLHFMGATARSPLEGQAFYRYKSERPEAQALGQREFTTKTLLWGYPAWPHARGLYPSSRHLTNGHVYMHDGPYPDWGYSRMFKTLKGIDLSQFYFRDFAHQTAVLLDNAFVKCSTFYNDSHALIILGNPESNQEQEVNFSVDLKAFGWGEKDKMNITEISGAPSTFKNTGLRNMKEQLLGYDFRVYRLVRIEK